MTAAIVSFGRGVGLSDDKRDAHARELLPFPFRQALDALNLSSRARPLLRTAARVASAGLVDHASLRMSAVDAVVVVRTAPPDPESPMSWREELRTGRLFVFLRGWRPPYQP